MFKYAKFMAILAFPLLSGCATTGGSAPNLQQMLRSIESLFPSLWAMVTAFCMIAGIALFTKALFDFHMIAKMSGSMMGSQSDPKPTMFMMGLAGLLMLIPYLFNGLTTTLFGTGAGAGLLGYQPIASSGQLNLGMNDIVNLVRFVGLVAFVRGMMILTHYGSRNGQPQKGDFQKAMTHIIGGLLGVNILATTAVVMAALGFSSPISS